MLSAHRICSPELLSNEVKQIKLLLNKNRYPQDLVNKTKKLHLKNLDRIKTVEPEKFIVISKFPFINKSSEILENKIKYLIRNTYYAANPRIVFTTKPLLTPGGNDPLSTSIKV